MRKISIPAELGWARPGTYYDIAPLELYYLRATILEGYSRPRRASRDMYFLCIWGEFDTEVKGKTLRIEQGDLLEIRQGEEYTNHANGRAIVVVLEP
jgi:mannose-6-phosphate isomerase-like protein (cupin superfamily)